MIGCFEVILLSLYSYLSETGLGISLFFFDFFLTSEEGSAWFALFAL